MSVSQSPPRLENEANHCSASQTLMRPGSADSCSWQPTCRRSSGARVLGSRPSTRRSPASPLAQALQALDGRRLACPVTSQQPEDLSPGHLE